MRVLKNEQLLKSVRKIKFGVYKVVTYVHKSIIFEDNWSSIFFGMS